MKKAQKQVTAWACMVLLCVNLLCPAASAATLVVIDLANMVDEISPSVVEVFTETKKVSNWFQEYVTEGAGSGVILTEDGYIVTNVGDVVKVVVSRNGKETTVNVKLTERKST